MDQYVALAERIGAPLVLLVLVCWGIWKIVVWLGTNVVLPATNAHISLINETVETSKKNADILARITEHNETRGNVNLQLTKEIHEAVVQKKPGG